MGFDGQPLPYIDRLEFDSITDATTVDTAYRGKNIDIGGFRSRACRSRPS